MKRFAFLAAMLLALLGPMDACAAPLKIVASFSILADMAQQIAGEKANVSALVGRDADAHLFQPSPGDVRRVAEADLVILNGLGFEGWMENLLRQAGTGKKTVTASAGIDVLHLGGNDHGHGAPDPHAWQSVPNAMIYVANIRNALVAADPTNEAHYRANTDKYLMELRTLDAWIRAQLGRVPAAGRRILTNHDAFGYFAREYGVNLLAAQAGHKEASAAHIAGLVGEMRAQNIKAVFIENISNPALMQKLQRQENIRFGGKLYSDALSAKPPVDTYLGMMRWNATAIAQVLK